MKNQFASLPLNKLDNFNLLSLFSYKKWFPDHAVRLFIGVSYFKLNPMPQERFVYLWIKEKLYYLYIIYIFVKRLALVIFRYSAWENHPWLWVLGSWFPRYGLCCILLQVSSGLYMNLLCYIWARQPTATGNAESLSAGVL